MALIYITGRDPQRDVGGHQDYVRAHAQAAIEAGYRPHIFCVHDGSAASDGAISEGGGVISEGGRVTPEGGVTAEIGVLHRVPTLASTVRHPFMMAHTPYLVRAALHFLASRPEGHHLVHGFGPWAYGGAMLARALRRRGAAATTVANAYATLAHDWRGKLRGLGRDHGAAQRLRYLGEYAWIRTVAGRCERRGYEEARLVLVNYESVRRLVAALCRRPVEIRRLPYAASAAFSSRLGEATAAQPGRRLEPVEPAAESRPSQVPPMSTISPVSQLWPVPPEVAALEPAGAPLVVAVARHDPRKALDILLRALAALRGAGVPWRACLVGPGTLLEAHRQLAARLGLGSSVAIAGRVPDPMPYLHHADLFVLPSLEEGSGSVALLEAMQAGCAVIASACDGIPEDLSDGDSALLVPPGDQAALAAALRRALNDPALRRRLAAGARSTFESRFSRRTFVAALGSTYRELGFQPQTAE